MEFSRTPSQPSDLRASMLPLRQYCLSMVLFFKGRGSPDWALFGEPRGATLETVRGEPSFLLASINCLHFSIRACHPCAGAMLIFSASFQF